MSALVPKNNGHNGEWKKEEVQNEINEVKGTSNSALLTRTI